MYILTPIAHKSQNWMFFLMQKKRQPFSPRPPVDAKTLAPTGLKSFVVHEEPRMVAVPQFLSLEESLGRPGEER